MSQNCIPPTFTKLSCFVLVKMMFTVYSYKQIISKVSSQKANFSSRHRDPCWEWNRAVSMILHQRMETLCNQQQSFSRPLRCCNSFSFSLIHTYTRRQVITLSLLGPRACKHALTLSLSRLNTLSQTCLLHNLVNTHSYIRTLSFSLSRTNSHTKCPNSTS